LIAARSAAESQRSGGAERKGVLGEGNSRPALASAAAIFSASFAGASPFVFNLSDNDKKLKTDFFF
jgi:hypothetical protein